MKTKKMVSLLCVAACSLSLLAVTAYADGIDISGGITNGSGSADDSQVASDAEYTNFLSDVSSTIDSYKSTQSKVVKEKVYEAFQNDISNAEVKTIAEDYLNTTYPAIGQYVAIKEGTIKGAYMTTDFVKSVKGTDGSKATAFYSTFSPNGESVTPASFSWTFTGKTDEADTNADTEYETSLNMGDIKNTTISGDGSVSFGLIVNGVYYNEEPAIANSWTESK